eukprot:TRINITY_DN11914_c0_g1_i1.p1 TRINITY_DN11914_c0_g1~~TRINITY_DN11914_c0_g1_i1.p1  ORF type:complete len:670 (+),score=123.40 TRINITY_DN11914_c0_g1_i1:90-2099(+)
MMRGPQGIQVSLKVPTPLSTDFDVADDCIDWKLIVHKMKIVERDSVAARQDSDDVHLNPVAESIPSQSSLRSPVSIEQMKMESPMRQVASCPRGHSLRAWSTPTEGFGCDRCGEDMPQGTQLWGCRLCNWDVCESCRIYPCSCSGAFPCTCANTLSHRGQLSRDNVSMLSCSSSTTGRHSAWSSPSGALPRSVSGLTTPSLTDLQTSAAFNFLKARFVEVSSQEVLHVLRLCRGNSEMAADVLSDGHPDFLSEPREWFVYFDMDGDGLMSKEELVEAVLRTFKLEQIMHTDVLKFLEQVWPPKRRQVIYKDFCARHGLRERILERFSPEDALTAYRFETESEAASTNLYANSAAGSHSSLTSLLSKSTHRSNASLNSLGEDGDVVGQRIYKLVLPEIGAIAPEAARFDVRVVRHRHFHCLWTTLGTKCRTPFSLWQPKRLEPRFPQMDCGMRICFGYYIQNDFANPATDRKVSVLEVVDRKEKEKGYFATKSRSALRQFVERVFPRPAGFRLVWELQPPAMPHGTSTSLPPVSPVYLWEPIPPTDEHVAGGVIATTSKSAPCAEQHDVRCLPKAWATQIVDAHCVKPAASSSSSSARPSKKEVSVDKPDVALWSAAPFTNLYASENRDAAGPKRYTIASVGFHAERLRTERVHLTERANLDATHSARQS